MGGVLATFISFEILPACWGVSPMLGLLQDSPWGVGVSCHPYSCNLAMRCMLGDGSPPDGDDDDEDD